jgi:hypothetical protein
MRWRHLYISFVDGERLSAARMLGDDCLGGAGSVICPGCHRRTSTPHHVHGASNSVPRLNQGLPTTRRFGAIKATLKSGRSIFRTASTCIMDIRILTVARLFSSTLLASSA